MQPFAASSKLERSKDFHFTWKYYPRIIHFFPTGHVVLEVAVTRGKGQSRAPGLISSRRKAHPLVGLSVPRIRQAQGCRRHRCGKNTPRGKRRCREISMEDFLYFEAEAGHTAEQRQIQHHADADPASLRGSCSLWGDGQH